MRPKSPVGGGPSPGRGERQVPAGARGLVARRPLFELLAAGRPGGVTLVSAPAGSGKTELIRTWIEDAGLSDRLAWASVERGERDSQRFWLSIIRELVKAAGRHGLVEELSPTPDFHGEPVVERLLSDLGSLEEPIVLVVDDLHELRSTDALAQLELLLSRLPRQLQVVLATRRDPQLGLHRLRLSGDLTEVRVARYFWNRPF